VKLSSSVLAWQSRGRVIGIGGRDVFVTDTGEGEVPLVLIHGFPGSSHDWSGLVPLLPGRVITLDLPGYGFSDKAPDAAYTLLDQADVVEGVLAELGVLRCVVVGHDMGDTVTAELAHRSNAGELGFAIEQIVLTNGSVFIDLAQLTRGQKLTLRTPNRASFFSMPRVILRRSLMESFTRTAPPPPGAVDDLIAMIRLGRGDRLMPRLIRYIEERRVHQDRWTAGFVDYPGPLTMIWGEVDPIAVLPMTERMKTLRPSTKVVGFPGVGHWPAIEAPERLAEQIVGLLRPEND
jgi:pimeloyl-ACP methyl ester carboxylesterase